MKYARVETGTPAPYLHERFLYKVIRFNEPLYPDSFWIKDDKGVEIYCRTNNCAHLNGGNWKIVEVNSR